MEMKHPNTGAEGERSGAMLFVMRNSVHKPSHSCPRSKPIETKSPPAALKNILLRVQCAEILRSRFPLLSASIPLSTVRLSWNIPKHSSSTCPRAKSSPHQDKQPTPLQDARHSDCSNMAMPRNGMTGFLIDRICSVSQHRESATPPW